MHTIGLFPGSFDPFTKGHEGIVQKSLDLFDEVIIGIGVNASKTYLFDLQKRIDHIQSLFKDYKNVKVLFYNSLTTDFCKEVGATHIIRGLRDTNDFEYEKSIAHVNQTISGIETVFFITDQHYASVSATIIREIYKNKGDISLFVTNAHLLV